MTTSQEQDTQAHNELFHLTNVAFKDILTIGDLSIYRGTTAIVGESGGGKTTFLQLLNRLISPDHGTICYEGDDIAKLNPVHLRRKVVMLAQNPVIFPGDLRDNLLAGIHFANLNEPSDEELTSVLDKVKLAKDLDADPDVLSGGERQRVAIARMLLMKPEVMLLDEPSSALDDDMEEDIIDMIRNEAHRRSAIMVTHSQTMARRFATRIIRIHHHQAHEVTGDHHA